MNADALGQPLSVVVPESPANCGIESKDCYPIFEPHGRAASFFNYLQSLFEFAADHGVHGDQLAISLAEARAQGVRDSELRLLIIDGVIHHLREITKPSERDRQFLLTAKSLCFDDTSCFVICEAIPDANYPCESKEETPSPASDATGMIKPSWNRQTRCLIFNGTLIKRFRVPAAIQQRILAAFEEEGWPDTIDDPLPPLACIDAKQRLRDTVRCLNRNRIHALIQFCTVDNGQSIQWLPSPATISTATIQQAGK